MTAYSFAIFAFGICSLFSGIIVISRRNDFLGKLFFFYSLALTSWGIGASVMLNNQASHQIALWAIRYADGSAFFIPVMWIHLVGVLTDSFGENWKQTIRYLYALCFLLFPVAFTPYFIPNLQSIMGFEHFTDIGPLFTPLTILYFSLVPYGFFKLLRYLFDPNKTNKRSILGFSFFSLIGYSAGALCFPPAYGIPVPLHLLFLMPVYPLGLGFCIMRLGLFTEEELAEAAHKDKLATLGMLTASINHEIRNPLFVLRGMLERQTESKNNITPDQITTMQNQIERIESIIRRFNQFAKASPVTLPQLEQIDLAQAIDAAIEIAHYEIHYHSVEIRREIPKNLPKILAEGQALEQILFNLIVNGCQALRATKDPKIKISTSPSVGRQSSVVSPSSITIVIEDNGPGISKESLAQIFRPFYTTKNQGTGLGLYITKRLIESMKGQIEVSSFSQGTTFKLTFKSVS